MDDFLSISGDVIKAAEAAAEYKMVVPTNARISNKNPELKFWEEAGSITSVSSSIYTDNNSQLKIRVLNFETTCSAEGSGDNIGFPIKTGLRICPVAMASGSPDNLAKMSFMSTNRLTMLLRGVGILPDSQDGGYSGSLLATCFPPDDAFPPPTTPSPLVGKSIRFEVKQGPSEGRDGKKRFFPEIITIFEPI
jgi:hypothetical protein